MSQKRRFARYVDISGELKLEALMQVARDKGMVCIDGFKAGWCCWNSIGLYGTKEAMQATEAAWKKRGHQVKARIRPAMWAVDTRRPRAEWVDTKIADRQRAEQAKTS